MTRTTALARLGHICCIALAILGLTVQAGAQEPTACIGDDIAELRAASAQDPENIGLRLRIVRKQLAAVRETDNRRKAKDLLDEVRKQIDEIRELEPEFAYVYRVLARQYYRKGDEDPAELEKTLEVLDQHAKIAELDFDMRALRARSMLRLSWHEKGAQPERAKDAARYVADWLDSATAPVWGATLAVLSSWMIDDTFRDEILRIQEERYTEEPDNLNLALTLAGCYYTVGRNESAWRIVRESERRGLCDDITGGRHPVVEMLSANCYEYDQSEESYDGLDLDRLRELVEKYPENVSFTYRLAVRLRAKGFTGERIVSRIEQRVEERREDDPSFDSGPLEEQKAKVSGEVEVAYREAIPHAQKTIEMNGKIDAAVLLLGDLYTKVGDLDAAANALADGIQRVPFFYELRDKLADVEARRGNWRATAEQLAEVCKLSACRSTTWKDDVPGSILPVPQSPREKLILKMVENEDARSVLIEVFTKAAEAEPRNPNLRSYLAMIYYYADDRAEATRWMLEAERNGLCGPDGYEHDLAIRIYSRERW